VEQKYQITYSEEPMLFKGLDAHKKYQIKELNVYPGTTSPIDTTKTYSGEYLMKVGFNPDVSANRSSVILEVTVVK